MKSRIAHNCNDKSDNFIADILGTGAVVAIDSVTRESPLPEPTCAGAKVQLVNAGSFEQEKVTFAGNAPVLGFTSMLNVAVCPAAMEELAGEAFIVKSNVWFARAEKLTATECEVEAVSVPTALMLKLYA